MRKILLLVLAWCGINTMGEILIKFGSRTLTEPESFAGVLRLLWELIHNPLIMIGVIISAADLVLWIYILKNGDLGLVVPLTSINYIFALAAGWWLFQEPLSASRIFGILLICCGTFFISN